MDDDCGFIEFDVPEYSNAVMKQLNDLRLQGKLCDIIVHIQGQPFQAHKAVLAASSPYFRDHSSLGTMSGLSLSVIKSPAVFEQLLAFCYTGHMDLQLRDVVSFLTAASFLQMQTVIDKCTQILEGLHSKISLPVPCETDADESLDVRAVKEASIFLNPTQISPTYLPRKSHRGEASNVGKLIVHLAEEAQSDRGNSDCASEQDVFLDAELDQGNLNERNEQIKDIQVKMEKNEQPSYSDNSSVCDDGYHTEMVDGEHILAVTVGSSGLVLPPAHYTYSAPPSSYIVNTSPSSPRSNLSGFQSGRRRSKRPVPLSFQTDSASHQKLGNNEAELTATGVFENDVRERGLHGQWYSFNERLVCIYCGKSFNQKGSLDRHMRLHMGITPFACKYCGKKYTRKDQLEYHIRGHTDNKPFHCQVCGKCFPFQGTLNQHLRKKHMIYGTEMSNHTGSARETSNNHCKAPAENSEGVYRDVLAKDVSLNEESVKPSPQGSIFGPTADY